MAGKQKLAWTDDFTDQLINWIISKGIKRGKYLFLVTQRKKWGLDVLCPKQMIIMHWEKGLNKLEVQCLPHCVHVLPIWREMQYNKQCHMLTLQQMIHTDDNEQA